jgi:hypothetical protein
MPIPAPPTTDPTQAPDPATVSVSGAGSGSRGDALKQWLNNFTGGGMPEVQKQIDQHHQQRLADVQLHAKTWKDLQTEYAANPNGKYWTKDAQGKPTPTPEGQQLLMQIQTAQQAFTKVAGVNKESKSIIGKLGQVVGAVSHHGREQQQEGALDASVPGNTTTTGMPAPPSQPSPATGSAPPTASGMPGPPNAQPASAYEGDTGVRAQQDQAAAADAAKLDFTKKEEQAKADVKGNADIAAPKQLLDGLVKAGLSQEEAQKVVREKYSGIAGRPKSVMYSDPSDPTKKLFGTEVGGVVYDQQGESVPNAGQVVPAMLPSASSSTSVYNADTGTTTTSHSTQKVAPKVKTSMPAPPSGGSSKPSSSSTKPSAAGGGLAAMAEDWVNDGIVPQAKDKRQVEMYMKAHGQEAPVTLIPEAQKTIIAASPVMDQINGLLKDIDDLKLGDNNKSAYLLPARAEYALGHASPEGSLGKDIAGLSLGSVVEAASVLKGTSRSVLALKKALEHTPNPWVDSPKLMKEKLQTIQARLKDVMDDAYKYGKKGAAVGYGPSHMPAPPPRGTGTKDDPIIVSP